MTFTGETAKSVDEAEILPWQGFGLVSACGDRRYEVVGESLVNDLARRLTGGGVGKDNDGGIASGKGGDKRGHDGLQRVSGVGNVDQDASVRDGTVLGRAGEKGQEQAEPACAAPFIEMLAHVGDGGEDVASARIVPGNILDSISQDLKHTSPAAGVQGIAGLVE